MTELGVGIPEWEDADAYPKKYEDIYEGDWRWQFLRRDPEYQKAWSHGIIGSDPPNVIRLPAPEDADLCRNVFRLTHLPNPWGKERIPNAPGNMWDAGTGALTINPPNPEVVRGRDFIMVGFDLNLPLKPQMDRTFNSLKFYQKSLKSELLTFKKQKDKWPKYIRVIDAFDQGATATEVYNQFASEIAADDDDRLDDFYRPGSQPDATALGWHSRALNVMEMAIRLL